MRRRARERARERESPRRKLLAPTAAQPLRDCRSPRAPRADLRTRAEEFGSGARAYLAFNAEDLEAKTVMVGSDGERTIVW